MAGDTSTVTKRVCCLFDVDGTLTKPRNAIESPMVEMLEQLKSKATVGLVGGSDLKKISEQMTHKDLKAVTEEYDYVFSENGLVAYKKGQHLHSRSIADHLGEETIQKFINFALKELSAIQLPVKRGTFIEFRKGLINVCPVGRSCSQAERDQFAAYDKEHHIRTTLVDTFKKDFAQLGLEFIIGGQISIDVFPTGWDKRYCLETVLADKFDEIHFFGDKTAKGGNDHEIFEDPRTVGHTVTGPEDTIQQLKSLFFK